MALVRLRLMHATALLSALALSAALATPAEAETGILLADARSAEHASLDTGQQLLLENRSGAFTFAGQRLDLDGFTGVVGYSNELAYVTVIEGSASAGEVRAERGWMLMLPPYGGEPMRERFDAIRFSQQWSEVARGAAPKAYASLEALGRRQGLGVFFGRYGQTGFNVAASGSADRERARRALLGAEAVRDVRFSGENDPHAIEQRVVTTFLAALIEGDAEAVAALMDPTPFGGRALAGGAQEARVATARTMIASRDWRALIGSAEPTLSDGQWRAGAVRVRLRSVDDFTFVGLVQGG